MKIEFDGVPNTVIINGVQVSFNILESMTNPDPRKLYRYERVGDTVTVYSFHDPEMVIGGPVY